jgi:hypothetical protein
MTGKRRTLKIKLIIDSIRISVLPPLSGERGKYEDFYEGSKPLNYADYAIPLTAWIISMPNEQI